MAPVRRVWTGFWRIPPTPDPGRTPCSDSRGSGDDAGCGSRRSRRSGNRSSGATFPSIDDYPHLDSILVYPSAYVAKAVHRQADGVVSEELSARLGESWSGGAVVLSRDDVRRGAADIHDGHNVVMHAFAHELDRESGAVEGAPLLETSSMYVAWARVLGAAYEKLRQDVAKGRRTFLSSYAATDPAEFFAVATEIFFERPAQLMRYDP